QYPFCLTSTSRALVSCSFTLPTSAAVGTVAFSESIIAKTAFDSISTFSGDELNCTVISYSCRGTRPQPPPTLGLYVPPSFSRRFSSSLIWKYSISARNAKRVSGAYVHAPVNSIRVSALGSTPLWTTFSTTPFGGAPPLSRKVSPLCVDGSDARYFST